MRANLRTLLAATAVLAFTASACNCGNPNPGPGGNQPPTVDIQSPIDGMQLKTGETVALNATATDPEDGPLSGASVVWTSSISGQLATGDTATATINDVGDHVITVTATDSAGQSASKSVNVHVASADAPTVKITAPASGTTVDLNQVLTFTCDAKAVDGTPIPASGISWTSALSGPLPGGATMQAALTASGADTITCKAVDVTRNNASAQDSISITVSNQQASTIQITQPNRPEIWVKPGGMGPFSNMVNFTATARDPNVGGGPGNLDAAIHWTLNPGNVELGLGATAAHTFADLGDFTVTASATDSRMLTVSDTVTVHVVNNIPPQCQIQNPAMDGVKIPLNSMQNLNGGCFDPETQNPIAPTWTTSAQTAALGTGFNIQATFSVLGDQTISACAVDPTDATLKGCATRQVTVFTNTAPTNCTITAPTANQNVAGGTAVTLTGSATDAEDPLNTLQFRWASNVDGPLAFGANTTTTALTTAGAQVITLTVRDPAGLTCTATVNVTVNAPPTVQITAATQPTKDCLQASCDANTDVSVTGTAMDPDGIGTYAWTDSVVGAFGGNSAMATLTAPPVGKHTLVLTATDTLGAQASAVRTIKLLASGKTNLVETFVNTGNDAVGIAIDATGVVRFVDGQNQSLFSRVANVTTTQNVQDNGLAVFTLGSGATAVTFVGTDGSGVARCTAAGCTNYQNGALQQAGGVVNAVAAMDTPDVLFVGSDDGLVITKASDPGLGGANAAGQRVLQGRRIRALAISPTSTATSVTVWVGTDNGLQEVVLAVNTPFDPLTAAATITAHHPPEIPANDVRAVTVTPAGVPWAGTQNGFGALNGDAPAIRGAPWNFPDDNVTALVFERRTIGSTQHDLIWAGTQNGLVRYDTGLKIPTRFSTQDGLPSNFILSLALDASGVKYIGTSQGISKYDGP